jgi:ribosomal protein L29
LDKELLEQLNRIDQLSDPELAELEAQLVSAAEEAAQDDSDEGLERLGEVRDAIARVRTMQHERLEAAKERDEKRQALLAEINPPSAVAEEEPEPEASDGGGGEPDEPEGEGADSDGPQGGSEDDSDSGGEPAPEVVAVEKEPEPVAASATPSRAPMPRRIFPRPPREAQRDADVREDSRVVITAAGDVPRYSAGQEIGSLDALGEAFAHKAQAALGSPGYYPVATVTYDWPEERVLSEDPSQNRERIEAVISPEAITAAGGLCAPPAVSYDLFGISVESRPFRDALPGFSADRGGIQFVTPPTLASLSGSAAVVTEAQDATPNFYDTSPKPCLVVACGATVEVLVSAVTRCLQVGNFNRRFFPEQFDRFWQLAGAWHARLAEQTLLARAETESTLVTTGRVFGTARDVIENLIQAGAAYRLRHRTADNLALRMVAPMWLYYNMMADLVRQMPGDDAIARAAEIIDAGLRSARINPVWSPDYQLGVFAGAQAAGTLNAWPLTVDVLLYAEGTFIFTDGGTLDFGMEIRDTTMNAANNVRSMTETFENLAKVGVESLRLRMQICADGSAAALQEEDPCLLAS